MHCICAILFSHLWPATLYNIFPHYLINGTIFEKRKKKVIENKTCVLIISKSFAWNVSHSKKKSARYDHKTAKCSCKIPVIHVSFNKTWFFDTFSKNTQISNFMKIRLVGTELFHVDRQKRHNGANSSFSQFCESAQKADTLIYRPFPTCVL